MSSLGPHSHKSVLDLSCPCRCLHPELVTTASPGVCTSAQPGPLPSLTLICLIPAPGWIWTSFSRMACYRGYSFFLRLEPTSSGAEGSASPGPASSPSHRLFPPAILMPWNKTIKGGLSSTLYHLFLYGVKQEQRGLCPTMQQNRKRYTYRLSPKHRGRGRATSES